MSNFCNSCGDDLDFDYAFCGNCGTKIPMIATDPLKVKSVKSDYVDN